MSKNILTENFTEEIRKALLEFPFLNLEIGKKFIFIENPYMWSIENNINGIYEGDIAFADLKSNRIILKKQISQEKKNLVLERINLKITFLDQLPHSFSPANKRLDTDEKFILHTVYHEIGHLMGISQKDETQADIFAFKQMGYKVVEIIT